MCVQFSQVVVTLTAKCQNKRSCPAAVSKDPRGALMFLVSLTLKLLACKVWKLDPPGALPFFIRIYNCLSMGLPIQSEYSVIRKTH